MSRKEMTETQKEKNKQMRSNETKEQKFKRISKRRIVRILKDLNLINKMVKSSQYDLTQDSFNAMYDAIAKNLISLKTTYDGRGKKSEEIGFEF